MARDASDLAHFIAVLAGVAIGLIVLFSDPFAAYGGTGAYANRAAARERHFLAERSRLDELDREFSTASNSARRAALDARIALERKVQRGDAGSRVLLWVLALTAASAAAYGLLRSSFIIVGPVQPHAAQRAMRDLAFPVIPLTLTGLAIGAAGGVFTGHLFSSTISDIFEYPALASAGWDEPTVYAPASAFTQAAALGAMTLMPLVAVWRRTRAKPGETVQGERALDPVELGGMAAGAALLTVSVPFVWPYRALALAALSAAFLPPLIALLAARLCRAGGLPLNRRVALSVAAGLGLGECARLPWWRLECVEHGWSGRGLTSLAVLQRASTAASTSCLVTLALPMSGTAASTQVLVLAGSAAALGSLMLGRATAIVVLTGTWVASISGFGGSAIGPLAAASVLVLPGAIACDSFVTLTLLPLIEGAPENSDFVVEPDGEASDTGL